MKQIWAPWRMEYILGPKENECIFCTRLALSDDRRNLIVQRTARAFVIMNRYPYTNGHLMVAPLRHEGKIELLTEEELLDVFRLVQRSVVALRRAFNPEAFNIGSNLGKVAGAGVEDHFHVHVVPRFTGDTNFMPILDETKVICEYLGSTYERLRASF